MRTLIACLVVITVAIYSSPALATDRYFRDLSVQSADGRWQLEAKSPDNAGPKPRPFARNFKYRLLESETQREIWVRQQPENEASPIAAWVHENGTVVLRSSSDGIIVLQAADGKKLGTVRILEQFPGSERDKYVQQTTAGPMWAESSRWYFVDLGGQAHFVVRAWWGRRVIVNLATAARVEESPEIKEALSRAEHADLLQTLGQALRTLKDDEDRIHPMFHQARTAAHLAGKERIEEAIPHLRELEQWDDVGSCVSTMAYWQYPFKPGDIDPGSYCICSIRLTAQTSLRRLGQKPEGLPALWFYETPEKDGDRDLIGLPYSQPRHKHVGRVVAGLSARDVLQLIGPPDFVKNSRTGLQWEYDMDALEPFTFEVRWSKTDPEVVGVSRVAPRWTKGDGRDEDLR